LEISLDDLRRALELGLQKRGLSQEFTQVFPFDDIVATGLQSHSEHWAGLALKWAEHLSNSPRLLSALAALGKDGPTQRLRHDAQRLLARWRRAKAKST
jgi:hypothetical protein